MSLSNLKKCPQCNRTYITGNYCSECGCALVPMSKQKVTCPCCGGSGKIAGYGPQWARWQISEPQAVLNIPLKLKDCITPAQVESFMTDNKQ